MKDTLGDRIKSQYEDRTRIALPRRTYTIIRVDGKAFHTFLSILAGLIGPMAFLVGWSVHGAHNGVIIKCRNKNDRS